MAVVVVVFNEMPDYSEDITSSLAPSKPGESRKRGYKMLNQNKRKVSSKAVVKLVNNGFVYPDYCLYCDELCQIMCLHLLGTKL